VAAYYISWIWSRTEMVSFAAFLVRISGSLSKKNHRSKSDHVMLMGVLKEIRYDFVEYLSAVARHKSCNQDITEAQPCPVGV